MLNLIDEHTRESLLVRPERRWSSAKVIESLADMMVMKGVPEHIRSDNGPEFVAKICGSGLRTLVYGAISSVTSGASAARAEPDNASEPTAIPES
jgi:hypothetical protein